MQPIIIGGGIIGLSIGWHLIQRGLKPIILDEGNDTRQTSLAAAGMITPSSEIRFGEDQVIQLFLESFHAYPSWIESVESASDMKVDFRSGCFLIAVDQDDEALLSRFYTYQKELGLQVTLRSPKEVLEKEPYLNPKFKCAVETGEYFLDNHKLLMALRIAIQKAGGSFIQGQVRQIDWGNEILLHLDDQIIKANQVVIATGIDTTLLPGIPLRPIKGQALEVDQSRLDRPLSHAIRTIHRYPVYLVPRSDGRLIIGATSEEKGLDRRITAGAIMDLLAGAWKIFPAIEEMEWKNVWCGLRAALPDHAPILGPGPSRGQYLALGMYRHGFLLAPLVGKIMADCLLGKMDPKLETFSWKRFSKESSAL